MQEKKPRKRKSITRSAIYNLLQSSNEAYSYKELNTKFSGSCDRVTIYRALDRHILSKFMEESAARGIQAYYEMLASQPVYPSRFNPNMKEVLQKLPVKMTPMEDWLKMHKEFFIV